MGPWRGESLLHCPGSFVPPSLRSLAVSLRSFTQLSLAMSQISWIPVGLKVGKIQRAHRLNVTPPYYCFDLPKSGLRLVVCDKPSSSKSYRNMIDIVDNFCVDVLRHKKARKFLFMSVIVSEIARTSDDPMEPPHMLLKFTLPTENGIAKAIPAHIYLTGSMPHAKVDTTCVFWKDAEEIAEHEILASHQAVNVRLDMLNYCSFPAEQIPHL
ncbi:uncharacterized protein B0H18DRAFT_234260 [Fomitopsis serialis]|uniref:uncharacterized protein n=1 Tax=Fomitopsis serialis TaxID=139415 RepID=UPI002007382A|nr:uncharacterized protein B0H18DRAFT_234260 [Neoantrodia serialis]KAH9928917.1 hypothetical protein B0H18DRAFT_234260 [Neoantrodia serialis]